MQLINTQEEFNKICNKLSIEKILFMDTEFHRRRTYYAILSIVQITSKEDRIIIDALAKIDLSPLKDLLTNENIIKVFHSPDQDFDIFYHLFGQLPRNVFDTQTAAGVCGMDGVMGYSRLCKALLNVDIDKTHQKANWLLRPLTQDLLEYAIRDTEFLLPLYKNLSKTMTDRKLWDTYETRIAKILDTNNYKVRPDRIMSKMNLLDQSKVFTNRLLHLIAFREECAQIVDLPRSFCATDKELIQICKKLPTTDKELFELYIQNQPIAKKNFKTKLFELCEGLKALDQ